MTLHEDPATLRTLEQRGRETVLSHCSCEAATRDLESIRSRWLWRFAKRLKGLIGRQSGD